jgi:hypothetical protein
MDIKINSLQNMLDLASNTPREKLMDFSKFLTGDGSNNLPNQKFPTQEELENELLVCFLYYYFNYLFSNIFYIFNFIERSREFSNRK